MMLRLCLTLSLVAVPFAPAVALAQWKKVAVPAVWKRPPGEIEGAGKGFAWYRCRVELPAAWSNKAVTLHVETADDARQYYINGQFVGQAGNFPPTFRTGLGETQQLKVDAKFIQLGKPNVLAIRVYQEAARVNFNVAAPVLATADKALRLSGDWEFRAGDGEPADALKAAEKTPSIGVLGDAKQILKSFKSLSGGDRPLSVAEALKRFKTPDDLTLEAVVAEPAVRQPLSFKWDERGRLWVVQYLQYPNPAGLTMISRDKYLRTVWDKVPPAPPHHFRGADKITIHEDSNNDGVYDKHKTFVDGLNIVSSFAIGRGGVWVLNPPYLLFYPDHDHDDAPDGDPQVHLEGFGLEDAHSVANSLRWGPDGWLYATQGSTVTGQIKKPGEKADKAVHSMGQLVWRYHPERRIYEIFAEGGGNAFGVEIDQRGRIYSGHNGGDTRGFHYVQGGYYRKGFGKHGSLSNPYAFGYFANMTHPKVPRFTHTFVIYDGAALPEKYNGKLFGVAPLLSHVVQSDFVPDRSSFQTKDTGHPITTDDPWFRPVDIQVGPDGAIYVADFYEQRIDHASHYQGRVHAESGRIYRLRTAGEIKRGPSPNLGVLTSRDLVEQLKHPNKWRRQTALRLLADRRDSSLIEPLKSMIRESTDQLALEFFWALRAAGGLDESFARETLEHADPYVRAWTVRLLCDDRAVSDQVAKQLAELAYREPHVEVRSQLACSARRLPAKECLRIVANLLRHDEDAGDIHLPLLLWWALENKVAHADQVVQLFEDKTLWDRPLVREHLLERLVRRFAASGKRSDLLACAKLFEISPSAEHGKRLLAGFETAFEGRSMRGLPAELVEALGKVGGGSLALRVRQGDAAAATEALAIVRNEKAKPRDRVLYIDIAGQIKLKDADLLLLEIVETSKNAEVRQAALHALQSFDNPLIGKRVVELLNKLPKPTQEAAFALLSSRDVWSLHLLAAIEGGTLAVDKTPLPVVRRMLLHPNDRTQELIKKHWGDVQGAATAEMKRDIRRFGELLGQGSGNPYNGKKLFANSCGKCHILFKQGGKIGPDLTAYKRDDLQGMLVNVVNPSIEIREGYENFAIYTLDGRALNGFIEEQDPQVVVLKSVEGQKTVIPRDDIDEMQALPRSIMPEGLLKLYSEQQVRDLFAYLRASQPLP